MYQQRSLMSQQQRLEDLFLPQLPLSLWSLDVQGSLIGNSIRAAPSHIINMSPPQLPILDLDKVGYRPPLMHHSAPNPLGSCTPIPHPHHLSRLKLTHRAVLVMSLLLLTLLFSHSFLQVWVKKVEPIAQTPS